MIHEVDEALRALVRNEAIEGSGIDVVFDAPTKDWSARRNAPTVNLFLYDIREDLRRRTRGVIPEYDDRGIVIARHEPPRFFKMSYLVTAWTQRPEDEHRLLAALLRCFMRHAKIPAELLNGPLAAMGVPVQMDIALPPPEDRAFADVWSALGGELKPSLDVVVIAPMDSQRGTQTGPPVDEPLILATADKEGTALGQRQGRQQAPEPDAAAPADATAPADDTAAPAGKTAATKPAARKRTPRPKR